MYTYFVCIFLMLLMDDVVLYHKAIKILQYETKNRLYAGKNTKILQPEIRPISSKNNGLRI